MPTYVYSVKPNNIQKVQVEAPDQEAAEAKARVALDRRYEHNPAMGRLRWRLRLVSVDGVKVR